LHRPVYWLSIGGNGATDPQAIWERWLAGVPSLSIELVTCRDGKCQDLFGARELRMHPSSPAISQMDLLVASQAMVEQLSVGAREGSGLGAQRAFEALSSKNFPLLRSWFRSFRVSL